MRSLENWTTYIVSRHTALECEIEGNVLPKLLWELWQFRRGMGEQIWSLTWYISSFDWVKCGGNIWTEGVEVLTLLHVDHYLEGSEQWRILRWWVATECLNSSHIAYYFKAREYWTTEIDLEVNRDDLLVALCSTPQRLWITVPPGTSLFHIFGLLAAYLGARRLITSASFLDSLKSSSRGSANILAGKGLSLPQQQARNHFIVFLLPMKGGGGDTMTCNQWVRSVLSK